MDNWSRREFIVQLAVSGALPIVAASNCPSAAAAEAPWYRTTYRWGQTNITEADPPRYDIEFWREHWKRTRVQGVIINAGGIFAFYPSRFPLQYRPQWLGDRDLFGELTAAAHSDGIVVMARMDSSRAAEPAYRAHPEWFAVDSSGQPYRAGDRYSTCVNSVYYEEFIPSILTEIAERYHPEGFTDNSWSGLGRANICRCENCARKFRDRTGKSLPAKKDWDDAIYREWIRWNYARRIEIWELNNRVTRAAGGPHCIWAGMTSGSITGQCASFRDYKAICERAEIIMLDHQRRSNSAGFQQNAEIGNLIHGLLGWEKLIPESMAMYQAGDPTYRLAAKPAPEARLWMLAGIAGGIQPWWHHVGAWHEDRRAYRTAEPVLEWHRRHQALLVERRPLATVGLVWSQENYDFYGRDEAGDLVETAWRGFTNALVRARIPYIPVHADHIDRDSKGLALLVLPNLAAVSDAQAAAIRRFVAKGGGVIGTGETSRYALDGEPRSDFALSGVFGIHATQVPTRTGESPFRRWARESQHSYLRLLPETHRAGDVASAAARHRVLRGFEETNILGYGGGLGELEVEPGAEILLTWIPPFPIYPPETAWMRQDRTNLPGLVLRDGAGSGRIAFLPADLDRRFARDNLPDHGNLLANLVRWAARDNIPLAIDGPGFLDCHLYRKGDRTLLHIVNLTSAGTWRAPVDELIRIGPIEVRVRIPGSKKSPAEFLVFERKVKPRISGEWCIFGIDSILDHEFVAIG